MDWLWNTLAVIAMVVIAIVVIYMVINVALSWLIVIIYVIAAVAVIALGCWFLQSCGLLWGAILPLPPIAGLI